MTVDPQERILTDDYGTVTRVTLRHLRRLQVTPSEWDEIIYAHGCNHDRAAGFVAALPTGCDVDREITRLYRREGK